VTAAPVIDWWVVVPAKEAGAKKIPADAKVVGVPQGSATDAAFLNTQNVGGLAGFMGPFPTKASAQAARPTGEGGLIGAYVGAALGQLGDSIAPGTKAAVGGLAEGDQAGTDAQNAVTNPLGTLAEFLGVGSISGTSLVIRGVKIIVGGIMLLVGLVHMTGISGTAADYARKVPLPI